MLIKMCSQLTCLTHIHTQDTHARVRADTHTNIYIYEKVKLSYDPAQYFVVAPPLELGVVQSD
jgi:hypothetical protein